MSIPVNTVAGTNPNYSSAVSAYEKTEKVSENTKQTEARKHNPIADSDAVVYEKSDAAKTQNTQKSTGRKVDQETIDKLRAEADKRTAELRGLVEKLLLKQGKTVDYSKGLADVYRGLEVDEETRKQAEEDISEDGYWGVNQTSDRIVSFAKAMAGDDPEMAQKMLDAVKEGFKLAGEDWGEDLPDISKQTMKATLDKMDEWIKSLNGTQANDTVSDVKTTV